MHACLTQQPFTKQQQPQLQTHWLPVNVFYA
jgi:hypothetical protein